MCRRVALPARARSSLRAHHACPQQMSGVGEDFFIFSLAGAVPFDGNKTNLQAAGLLWKSSFTGTHLLFFPVIFSNLLWMPLEEPLAIAQLS